MKITNSDLQEAVISETTGRFQKLKISKIIKTLLKYILYRCYALRSFQVDLIAYS